MYINSIPEEGEDVHITLFGSKCFAETVVKQLEKHAIRFDDASKTLSVLMAHKCDGMEPVRLLYLRNRLYKCDK